jgi:hypothetical protein
MKNLHSCLIISILLLKTGLTQPYTEKDSELCSVKFQFAASKNLDQQPIGNIISKIGKSFIGTDYVSHTLEKDSAESLVINLSAFDCTTFLENTLAFAMCIKEKKTTFDDYKNELMKIRYRDGVVNGYSSRLNYFSDWIFDNQKKGIIQNISDEMGGVPIKFDVDYMSIHPDLYARLRQDTSLISVIRNQERSIAEREYYYIPKNQIQKAEHKINEGDLIAFTTGIKGLDIDHVGIAVKGLSGKIHLLHAPNVGSKVQITGDSLSDYIEKVKKDTGIIVMRVITSQN